jgi:hypothetical protein
MKNPMSYQRMLEIIEGNIALFQDNREFQEQINDLMSKISSPADRIKSLSILLGSNLNKLSARIARYQALQRQGLSRGPKGPSKV